MAKLTQTKADKLYTECEITKIVNNGVFEGYKVDARLDDFIYSFDSAAEGLSIDENSTDAQIKTALVDHWKAVNNQKVTNKVVATKMNKV